MSAYLQITLKVKNEYRGAAAAVYNKYLRPFLDTIEGAKSKDLLIRDEDVQVLHGFSSEDAARAYLYPKDRHTPGKKPLGAVAVHDIPGKGLQ